MVQGRLKRGASANAVSRSSDAHEREIAFTLQPEVGGAHLGVRPLQDGAALEGESRADCSSCYLVGPAVEMEQKTQGLPLEHIARGVPSA